MDSRPAGTHKACIHLIPALHRAGPHQNRGRKRNEQQNLTCLHGSSILLLFIAGYFSIRSKQKEVALAGWLSYSPRGAVFGLVFAGQTNMATRGAACAKQPDVGELRRYKRTLADSGGGASRCFNRSGSKPADPVSRLTMNDQFALSA